MKPKYTILQWLIDIGGLMVFSFIWKDFPPTIIVIAYLVYILVVGGYNLVRFDCF